MGNQVNPWWVSGLIDGEGCFLANWYKDPRPRAKGREYLHVAFTLGLRADDWAPILALVDYFGVGKVHSEWGKRKNPRITFKIHSKPELWKMVGHLKRYPLQSKKRQDADIWCEVAGIYLAGQHWEREQETRELATQLKAVRVYSPAEADQAFEKLSSSMTRKTPKTWHSERE
jgi:hypothetical protein